MSSRNGEVSSQQMQRGQVFILVNTGMNCPQIQLKLREVHGDKALPLRTVQRWAEKIRNGRTDMFKTIPPHQQKSGCRDKRLLKAVTDALTENPKLTIKEIAHKCNGKRSTVQRILTRDLKLTKLTSRWVPKMLTGDQMLTRVRCSKKNLEEDDDDDEEDED